MRANVLVGALLALALGAGALWFFTNFERGDENVFIGMSGEARTNRLLAFERWLVAMGRETRPVRSLADLDALPPRGVLVLARNRQALSAGAIERLRPWVEAGGMLLVEAERWSTDDPVTDDWLGLTRGAVKPRTGPTRTTSIVPPAGGKAIDAELPASQTVEFEADEDDAEDEKAEADGKSSADAAAASSEGTNTAAGGTGKPPVAATSEEPGSPVGMNDPGSAGGKGVPPGGFRLADDVGGRIVGLTLGKGRAVVFADFAPLVNQRFGQALNAELAWSIVRWGDGIDAPRGPFLVFTRPGKLSLWQWLVDNAFLVLVAAATLFTAWLARALARFGPVLPDPPLARRRIGDHLAASGRFLWRHGAIAPLARATRSRAVTGMERLAPGFQRMTPGEQITQLVRATGCTPEDARVLLATRVTEASGFTTVARVAQRVHAAIANRATARPARTTASAKEALRNRAAASPTQPPENQKG
jgi:hypothetical protein